jgi:rhodanese-related sulfurtransferase
MIRTAVGVVAILAIAVGVQAYRAGQASHEGDGLVPVASTEEVLALIREGKKVVFVDAREEQEWQEEHIPGAIRISLRDIASLDASTLGNPDLVIAYCLKDFRGFEVARALQDAGVKNSSILAELGINGWKKKGLPTVVANHRSEQVAAESLQACAEDPSQCQEKAL